MECIVENYQEIASALAATITIIISYPKIKEIYNLRVKFKGFRYLFSISGNEYFTVFAPSSQRIDRRYVSEIYDELYATRMFLNLQENSVKFQVRIEDTISESDKSGNMIFVGGPETNGATREALDASQMKFNLVKRDGIWKIADKFGKIVHPDVDDGRNFALIAKIKNPWNEKGVVIIAAGIGRMGTQGGVRFLSEHFNEIRKRIKSAGGKTGCFIGILECRFGRNGIVNHIDIIRFDAL